VDVTEDLGERGHRRLALDGGDVVRREPPDLRVAFLFDLLLHAGDVRLVEVELPRLRGDEHVLAVRDGVRRLHVDDLAEVVGERVLVRDVLDAVEQLDDVARVEAREVDVERTSTRVHRLRRIVGRAFARLDRLVDLAVLPVDPRAAELDRLAVRLEPEAVLARLCRVRPCEGSLRRFRNSAAGRA